MSAKVITLPVVRIERSPDAMADRYIEVVLEPAIFQKLIDVALKTGCNIGEMAEGLIVWGLATTENKSPEDFYNSLMLEKDASL